MASTASKQSASAARHAAHDVVASPSMSPPKPSPAKTITLIKDLCIYKQIWSVEALVLKKDSVHHWSNSRGSGDLFRTELVDSSGVDIQATFFIHRPESVEQWYGKLQVGSVYRLGGGKIKDADRKSVESCQSRYRLAFDDKYAQVGPVDGEHGIRIPYKFSDLKSLPQLLVASSSENNNAVVDILGVVAGIEASSSAEQGHDEMHLTLVDKSGCSIVSSLEADTDHAPKINEIVALWRAHGIVQNGGLIITSPRYLEVLSEKDERAVELATWWKNNSKTALKNTHSLTKPEAVVVNGLPLTFLQPCFDDDDDVVGIVRADVSVEQTEDRHIPPTVTPCKRKSSEETAPVHGESVAAIDRNSSKIQRKLVEESEVGIPQEG